MTTKKILVTIKPKCYNKDNLYNIYQKIDKIIKIKFLKELIITSMFNNYINSKFINL